MICWPALGEVESLAVGHISRLSDTDAHSALQP